MDSSRYPQGRKQSKTQDRWNKEEVTTQNVWRVDLRVGIFTKPEHDSVFVIVQFPEGVEPSDDFGLRDVTVFHTCN